MKILQVITSLLVGGAETLVVDLVSRLRSMGDEVDVCVFDGTETPLMQRLRRENPGVKIWKLGNGYYNPLFIAKLVPIMRRYDIVHTHNSSPQLFVAIASVLCSVGLCSTEHTTSNRKRGWKWYAPVESWMYGRYDHVICISKVAEEKLRVYMGGEWTDEHSARYRSISTIDNGVDVAAFHAAEPLPQEVTGRQKDDFVVTMVAGFREAKDQDTLVRAIATLPRQYKLWLVGEGVRIDIVRDLAAKLGVEERVRFWGLRTDVARVLKSSDVVCMSSHWEGLSLSNIEGMSAGKPFMASDVNGLREVTKGWGVLFPESDAEAVASELKRLHDDKDYCNAVADKCWQRARQFDIATTAERYQAVYETVAGSIHPHVAQEK